MVILSRGDKSGSDNPNKASIISLPASPKANTRRISHPTVMYVLRVVSTTLFLSGAYGMGYRVRSRMTRLVTCVLFCFVHFGFFISIFLLAVVLSAEGGLSLVYGLEACIMQ